MDERKQESAEPGEDADDRQQGGIQVIARTSRIMRALSAHPHGVSLAGIAAEVGLPRSTVQRIVTALVAENLAEPAGAAGGFRLGPALGQLIYQTEADIVPVARPHLERLSQALQETVCLSRINGRQTQLLEVFVGEQVLRIVPQVGLTAPLHLTADGKALLARMTPDEVKTWLGEDLPPRTDRSKGLATLLAELEEIRCSGFAYDDEEHTEGVSAVSASIGTYRGAYAITIIAPTVRLRSKVDSFREALTKTRTALERLLGTAQI
ncbi:IclR family transcriptional regulator [Aromatoleum bremense]|uniref:Helix-turn-helix domain-containing protein n=1 Tax=Aromatoleum bremense TaxID=76115 RepID=A0ABX1P0E1_9RHOO|nr:IclR family transcriptional regulator [Aromatoleum bremense]NMG17195.1 helix-turn-helix domain-containing protein [Aromatoleum bremense]QTQ30543.1 Transcriptional regulator, IclR-type [Aromatoleum bremense]